MKHLKSELKPVPWYSLLLYEILQFVAISQPINAVAFVIDGLYYGVSDFAYAAYSMVRISVFLPSLLDVLQCLHANKLLASPLLSSSQEQSHLHSYLWLLLSSDSKVSGVVSFFSWVCEQLRGCGGSIDYRGFHCPSRRSWNRINLDDLC
jgi:Na+-driven multidrug efflux pump